MEEKNKWEVVNQQQGNHPGLPYWVHELEQQLTLSIFNSYPKGYRFAPTGSELILRYLLPKIRGQRLPVNLIHTVINISAIQPDQLPAGSYQGLENQWYFFTKMERKYLNDREQIRMAGTGYWKAVTDKPIMHQGIKIGARMVLTFYLGNPGDGIKTDWIMHEFRVEGLDQEDISRKDEYVLCRIYEKQGEPGRTSSKAEQNEENTQMLDTTRGTDSTAESSTAAQLKGS